MDIQLRKLSSTTDTQVKLDIVKSIGEYPSLRVTDMAVQIDTLIFFLENSNYETSMRFYIQNCKNIRVYTQVVKEIFGRSLVTLFHKIHPEYMEANTKKYFGYCVLHNFHEGLRYVISISFSRLEFRSIHLRYTSKMQGLPTYNTSREDPISRSITRDIILNDPITILSREAKISLLKSDINVYEYKHKIGITPEIIRTISDSEVKLNIFLGPRVEIINDGEMTPYLPREIWNSITSLVSEEDIIRLSSVSKYFYYIGKEILRVRSGSLLKNGCMGSIEKPVTEDIFLTELYRIVYTKTGFSDFGMECMKEIPTLLREYSTPDFVSYCYMYLMKCPKYMDSIKTHLSSLTYSQVNELFKVYLREIKFDNSSEETIRYLLENYKITYHHLISDEKCNNLLFSHRAYSWLQNLERMGLYSVYSDVYPDVDLDMKIGGKYPTLRKLIEESGYTKGGPRKPDHPATPLLNFLRFRRTHKITNRPHVIEMKDYPSYVVSFYLERAFHKSNRSKILGPITYNTSLSKGHLDIKTIKLEQSPENIEDLNLSDICLKISDSRLSEHNLREKKTLEYVKRMIKTLEGKFGIVDFPEAKTINRNANQNGLFCILDEGIYSKNSALLYSMIMLYDTTSPEYEYVGVLNLIRKEMYYCSIKGCTAEMFEDLRVLMENTSPK